MTVCFNEKSAVLSTKLGLHTTTTRHRFPLWIGLSLLTLSAVFAVVHTLDNYGFWPGAIALAAFISGTVIVALGYRAAERRFAALGTSDPLTGLPTRTVLIDRLEHALARSSRSAGHVGVLFVDLDHFKAINDGLGHDRGDALLTSVANRLQGSLRPGDTAARLGADEFVLLCEDLQDIDAASAVASRIERALADPYRIDGENVVLTASVGVAIGAAGSTSEELLRNADRAMFRAKERGRSQFQVFTDGLASRTLARLEIERGLRSALDRDQLRLHFQPVVQLSTGTVVGAEALIRWEHPERGIVFPNEFIDIAEDSGAIVPIGRWALQEACRQAALQQARRSDTPGIERDGALGDLSVAVNVSARQVARGDFYESVVLALEASGLEAHRLCLELTESVLLEATSTTTHDIGRLKELGVRLAIDDFGTGYSSLRYLRKLPVDIVKVDRSFVAGLGVEPHDDAIVEAVIGLGRTFDIDVVAEGVERREQAERLAEMGCTYAQGFHFGRPVNSVALSTVS